MTEPTALLRRELAGLVRNAGSEDLEFVLIGGLGVLLRIEAVARRVRSAISRGGSVPRTLAQRPTDDFPPLPLARATRDLDLVLRAEVIVDPLATRMLRKILDDLGYTVIPGAEYYQFQKQLAAEAGKPVVKVDLSFWLLKLVACRDRIESGELEHAREHAYDLYALWAVTAEDEWLAAHEVSKRHAEDPIAYEARALAAELFGTRDAMGTLRIREVFRQRGIFADEDSMTRFRFDLAELLSGYGGFITQGRSSARSS